MNFLIIVSSDDIVNTQMLKTQVEKDDILCVENLSNFPSRTIHRILVNTKSRKCTKVIVVGPQSKVPESLLYYLRSYAKGHKALVIEDSRIFNISTHRFIRIPDYQVFRHDIVCFEKDIYRGRLADLSAHLQYEDILGAILQPVEHSIMIATRHIVEEAIENINNGEENPVDVFVEKIIDEVPLPPPPSYYVIPETFDDMPLIEVSGTFEYIRPDIKIDIYPVDNSYVTKHRDKYDPTITIEQKVNHVRSFDDIGIIEIVLDEEKISMEDIWLR